ncbi:MAG TPA: acVLRF1 family peptidyl-tRNA hydrolase [Propionibacteriaceae bacterium]|nr:acVLRF1 family peptidyl-tRNA hydrolase [Propionibacteriaceae bacterium]
MTTQRRISIPRERLAPWLEGFTARHGSCAVRATVDRLEVSAADGAEAVIRVPFPPLAEPADGVPALLRHVSSDRRIGALLVRKGGYAVGIFAGATLRTSKVGSSYVQGKTKAGGWSQQRYARRRDNQSRKAYADAADEVARLLLPERDSVEAIMTGGDKSALTAVLADPRLLPLAELVHPEVLAVPDPRLRVLTAFPEQFLAVRIELNELA